MGQLLPPPSAARPIRTFSNTSNSTTTTTDASTSPTSPTSSASSWRSADLAPGPVPQFATYLNSQGVIPMPTTLNSRRTPTRLTMGDELAIEVSGSVVRGRRVVEGVYDAVREGEEQEQGDESGLSLGAVVLATDGIDMAALDGLLERAAAAAAAAWAEVGDEDEMEVNDNDNGEVYVHRPAMTTASHTSSSGEEMYAELAFADSVGGTHAAHGGMSGDPNGEAVSNLLRYAHSMAVVAGMHRQRPAPHRTAVPNTHHHRRSTARSRTSSRPVIITVPSPIDRSNISINSSVSPSSSCSSAVTILPTPCPTSPIHAVPSPTTTYYTPFLRTLITPLPTFLSHLTHSHAESAAFATCFEEKLGMVCEAALDADGVFVGNWEMREDLEALREAVGVLRGVQAVGR
ncbi:uncharacterized protein EV422DRAFT_514841 [Fimicolochytrium jonesii]|uniref:uncharacterized protein n=1 Tax=Fimicolochytrium jonesii TaxID=1396493 RepID=UPI0022FF10D8|nr:uncharacterized protein EV422DRAFT_514841 [Fimicolochytrium jonesii]KAI8825966.1 hypothetical protein EV422DRAFT_514841 [Fimicolochytrium jonesii]